MTNKRHMWSTTLIAFIAAFLASRVALAVNEVEPNNPVAKAQPLIFDNNGVAEISGEIYTKYGDPRDVDFYSFKANANEDFDIAISNAWQASLSYTWTVIAVFGPYAGETYHLYEQANVGPTSDPNVPNLNPAIPKFHAQEGGVYYVGVSSEPGEFTAVDMLNSGTLYQYSPNWDVHGTYTLQVTRAQPAIQTIAIDIRPGRRDFIWSAAAVREYSGRGRDSDRDEDSGGHHELEGLRHHFGKGLPVALLSSDTFDAMDVDQSSLKFGSTGDEDSLMRCNRHGVDVNQDKRPDLICWFDFTKSDFVPGDNEGVVTGATNSGSAFEGKGVLKMVTGMPRLRGHDHDHGRRRHGR